ncbi:hypothetical protein CHS0354_015483 [Potamilus streckersoni]|uniref:Uncharacterized protein n=1 Tax=Potamilus streckersoni TaxID=2493646 RepID=A0AAE0SF26_9BIVA|nr:hypothetical protein CHS0354_015483 [Potamilus streckersoni]
MDFGGDDENKLQVQIRRFKKAQGEKFDLENVLDCETYKLLKDHASVIPCPVELLYFPFLAAVTSCFSADTQIVVHCEWTEKPVLSCLIGARRGERKTRSINTIKAAVRNIEQEIQALKRASAKDEQLSGKVMKDSLLINENDLKENFKDALCSIGSQRQCRVVLMDDFRVNFGSTDHFLQHISLNDFKNLYDGMTETSYDPRCLFFRDCNVSFAAMLQATDLVFICQHPDPGGLLDRSLVICAPEYLSPTHLISGQTLTTTLHTVLSAIRNVHKVQKVTYTFSKNGQEQLSRCIQKLEEYKRRAENEKVWGSLNQATGQIVRLSAVMTAVANGVTMSSQTGIIPSRVINSDVVKNAFSIIKTVIKQKWILFTGKDLNEEGVLRTDSDHVAHSTNTVNQSCASISGSDDVRRDHEKETNVHSKDDVVELSDTDEVTENSHQDRINTTDPGLDTPGPIITSVQSYSSLQGIPMSSNASTLESLPVQSTVGYGEMYIRRRKRKQETPFHASMEQHVDVKPMVNRQAEDSVPIKIVQSDQQAIDQWNQLSSFVRNNVADSIRQQRSMSDTSSGRGIEIRQGHHHQQQQFLQEEQPLQDAKVTRQDYQRHIPQPQQIFVNRASQMEPAHFKLERLISAPLRTTSSTEPIMASLYNIPDDDFIRICAGKIKKLLLTKGSIVTAAFACQYRLFPPIPKCQRKLSMKTSHPVWAAGKFFERLERLDLGTVLRPRGQGISTRFRKKRIDEMQTSARALLARINLPEEEYEKTYPKHRSNSDDDMLMSSLSDQTDNAGIPTVYSDASGHVSFAPTSYSYTFADSSVNSSVSVYTDHATE